MVHSLDPPRYFFLGSYAADLAFDEALSRRLSLLPITRAHVAALAVHALDRLTPSVRRNQAALQALADRLVIVSGGFRDVIAPVADWLGVSSDRVLANDLLYDAGGRVIGVDPANPLSQAGGKAGHARRAATPT